jgi:hypothetical protein
MILQGASRFAEADTETMDTQLWEPCLRRWMT